LGDLYNSGRETDIRKYRSSDGKLTLNKKVVNKLILITSLILCIIWILFLQGNFPGFQELRHSDPLWLVHSLYPVYYAIIGFFLLIFAVMFYLKCDSQTVHISYLSLLSLIIYGTPYFLSTYARFPDTIGVAGNVLALENVLLNQPYSYPANYPASYIFFKCIHIVSNLDLLYFARMIFAPLCLVGIIILWYIFISRQVNVQVAFLSSILIIPTQIVEISITPNSFAILLMLTALILYSVPKSKIILGSSQNDPHNHQKDPAVAVAPAHVKKYNYRKISYNILLFIVMVVLILAHPVNALIFLVMVSIFYISDRVFATRNFGISLMGLLFLCLIWVWWLASITTSGESLVRTLYRMISTESAAEVAVQYSTGSTGFVYSYIDQLFAFKYALYGFFALLLLLYVVYEYIRYINRKHFQLPITFLAISGILVAITMLNLMRGGTDIQNIISRTLNFAMYSLCTFIACSVLSLTDLRPKIARSIKIVFVLFLVFILLTYPVYSFARDSYINYPSSEGAGRAFEAENCLQDEKFYMAKNKATYFHSYMYGEITYDEMMRNYNSFISGGKVYSNDWYSLGVKT
jgi:hypothetical protein